MFRPVQRPPTPLPCCPSNHLTLSSTSLSHLSTSAPPTHPPTHLIPSGTIHPHSYPLYRHAPTHSFTSLLHSGTTHPPAVPILLSTSATLNHLSTRVPPSHPHPPISLFSPSAAQTYPSSGVHSTRSSLPLHYDSWKTPSAYGLGSFHHGITDSQGAPKRGILS